MMPTAELLDALRESTKLLDEAAEMHQEMSSSTPEQVKDLPFVKQAKSNRELLARASQL